MQNLQFKQIFQGVLASVAIALGSSVAKPAEAAERLILQIGPIQQSIAVADLDEFAKTGKLPNNLKLYEPVLTPQLREILTRRLNLDPNVGDKLVADLLRSPSGQQLIKNIGIVIPNSTVEEVQGALSLAIRQTNGLSMISFLRSYPAENVVIDVSSLLSVGLQFNLPYWQSQALGSLLKDELTVDSFSFRPTFDPASRGNQAVQQQTFTFPDQKRDRTILSDLYWARDTKGPLVLISHGFGSDRKFLAYLATHLASHGFTVVAVEHPGSNARWLYNHSQASASSTLLQPSEFIERPRDVSFVLDELAKLNQQSSWQGKFNTNQVTVIGHSFGGYTALALAGGELNLDEVRQFCQDRNPITKAGADWLQCVAADLRDRRLQLKDGRIVQAIALNPVVGKLFGKTGLNKVTIPTLILASTDDTLAPSLNHQLQPFTQLGGDKYLLTAIDATHLSISDPANFNPELVNFTLVKERTGRDVEPLRQLLRGVSLAFIEQLTPAARTYEPFLTPAYAQSLSTSTLPLRLNTTLPSRIASWFKLVS